VRSEKREALRRVFPETTVFEFLDGAPEQGPGRPRAMFHVDRHDAERAARQTMHGAAAQVHAVFRQSCAKLEVSGVVWILSCRHRIESLFGGPVAGTAPHR
jgi:hypothetical protein